MSLVAWLLLMNFKRYDTFVKRQSLSSKGMYYCIYRLEQLFETIRNLPNYFNMFSHADFPIYVLDDFCTFNA